MTRANTANEQGLPPRIGIDRPESFSRAVFQERHPVLVANLLADHPYPPRIRARLEALLAESRHGAVPREVPPGPNPEYWAAAVAEHAGEPWDAAPFLWAESYFYRRLLDAVEHVDPTSAWHGVDPFAPQKRAQLDGPELRADLDAYAALPDGPARRDALLRASLWGNQADLGFRTNNPGAAQNAPAGEIVADDAPDLWALVDGPGTRPVIVVADNAGRELTADLALVDALLATGPVELHLKPQPYFVSDATCDDVLASLAVLAASAHPEVRALADRLRAALGDDRLRLRVHDVYLLPTRYRDLPPALADDFAAARVVIFKGDLNYRRLVGDREWDPATPFAEAVGPFPGAAAALRTAKSDLAVGIAPARLAALDTEAPDWRTAGTHAVIQVSA